MTIETVVGILGAVTALVVAITALVVQLKGLRRDLNGHVTQLVNTSTAAAKREGELEGRDFMHRLLTGGPETPGPAASS